MNNSVLEREVKKGCGGQRCHKIAGEESTRVHPVQLGQMLVEALDNGAASRCSMEWGCVKAAGQAFHFGIPWFPGSQV